MHHLYQLSSRLEERPLSELFIAQSVAEPSQKRLVKLFHQRFGTPEFGRALQSEASRQAAAIGCPHLLAYEEIGLLEGRLSAVRPYVEGYALDDVIRRLYSKEVVLTAPLALYLVAETARVVAQAHARGVAHGALDSSNLLLGFDGALRVSGFGMMRAVGSSAALKAIAPKLHRHFRPPEQRDPCQASAPGDVYALGCVAYELLTLTSVAEVRGGGLSTKRDTLQPPSRLNRRINARIDPIIMRALEMVPSRRYQNAAQFAEALQSLFALLGTAVGPQELAHFSREVFPNEVSLTGGSAAADLPIRGPFSLIPLSGDGTPSTPPPFVGAQQSAASPATSGAEPASSGAFVVAVPALDTRPMAPGPSSARPASELIDPSELGASERELFEVAFGGESTQENSGGGRWPQEEREGERARQETREPPVALAPTQNAEAMPAGGGDAVQPPLKEASERAQQGGGGATGAGGEMASPRLSPPLEDAAPSSEAQGASAVDEGMSQDRSMPGVDPLASWEAPAGPMPALIRRASLSDVRAEGGTSAAPGPSNDGSPPLLEGAPANTSMPSGSEVAAPSASLDASPTTETPIVQQPLVFPGATTSAETAPITPSHEDSWNAFASPSKPSRSAKRQVAVDVVSADPQVRAASSEPEEDWRVRPQPPTLAKSSRPHRRRGWWAIACALALGLAIMAVFAFLRREPDTARLSKEALDKLSAALEHKVAPAYLSVETNAPAMVIINGKKSPLDAPFEKMALPPGRHIVRLVRDDEVREFGLFLEEGQHERRVENFTSTASKAAAPRAPRPRSPNKKPSSGR